MRHGVGGSCRYGSRDGHAGTIARFYKEDGVWPGFERGHSSDPGLFRPSLHGALLCQRTVCSLEIDWAVYWFPFFSPGVSSCQGADPEIQCLGGVGVHGAVSTLVLAGVALTADARIGPVLGFNIPVAFGDDVGWGEAPIVEG